MARKPATQHQKNFYHEQRVKAEETGDQGTVNRIYKKLGRKAPEVGGTDRVDRAILGGIAATGGGGLADAVLAGIAKRALGPMVGGGIEAAGRAGTSLMRRGEGAIQTIGRDIRSMGRRSRSTTRVTARVERPALQSGRKALARGKSTVKNAVSAAKPAVKKAAHAAKPVAKKAAKSAVRSKAVSEARKVGKAQKRSKR